MNTNDTATLSFWAKLSNVVELIGVLILLLLAFDFQFVLHELPCPLCLLQRLGFLGVAFALLMNVRYGQKPSHYALAQLFALFTAFVALRQIALHVVPGTGSYGSAIFGLHMYTWSFVIAMLLVVVTAISLGVDRQYIDPKAIFKHTGKVAHVLFALTLFLCAANVISVFTECGLKQCPDNPTHYLVHQGDSSYTYNEHFV